jgi:hypothetical protein
VAAVTKRDPSLSACEDEDDEDGDGADDDDGATAWATTARLNLGLKSVKPAGSRGGLRPVA